MPQICRFRESYVLRFPLCPETRQNGLGVTKKNAMGILASLQRFDVALFDKVFGTCQHMPRICVSARLLSRSGDGYMQLLTPAFVWFSGSILAPTYFVTLGLAMIIERAVYFVLKNTLKRLRPADFKSNFQSVITASDEFSFPSGHTSAAFCFSLITVTVLGGAFILLFLWAAVVGLSRLVLGVHFPGDILAGALVGSGVAVATLSLLSV